MACLTPSTYICTLLKKKIISEMLSVSESTKHGKLAIILLLLEALKRTTLVVPQVSWMNFLNKQFSQCQ